MPYDNAELVKRPALEGMIRPPSGMLERFRYYSLRYGFWHATFSVVGRWGRSILADERAHW